MIIFQLPPCRLYPKICELITNQYPQSLYIHEVFDLSNDRFFSNVNNHLNITPKNFKFQRSPITFGIFNINKIKKNPGDFYLTIKFDKEDLIKEYFAGLRYYGSLQFYKRISSKSDECLFNLVNKFNDLSDEELFDFIKNKENIHKPINYKGISYNFREELLNQDGNFDYIGNFNDWEKTIKEIKDKTNIDLTSLKEETTKSFKEQKYG